MSALSDIRQRIGRNGSSAPADPSGQPASRRPAMATEELDRRREDAARRYAEAHWDLGGLAYEMAVRDHFRLDVLQRQAAHVQELDADLAQLERLRMLEDEGAAGTCSNCGTPYGRGAGFCSKCGSQLVQTMHTT